jgi:hypothetical protein
LGRFLLGQAIQCGGVNLRVGVEATDVAIAHVVGKNIYDVRLWIAHGRILAPDDYICKLVSVHGFAAMIEG